jgi:hypothetical protein
MCIGAIYGILIWIEQPTERDYEASGCGPNKKFLCGRKKNLD